MDRRERMNSLPVGLRVLATSLQSGIWTALPATVNSYNASKVTVSAQPTIQAQVRTPDGVWSGVTMPLCLDCPVIFSRGGGYVLTFPIIQGDEGLLIFSSRCIDAWWQNGGVQPQAELRMHDLSDGFFLPGPFSQPNVPSPAPSSTAVELRSLDGKSVIHLEAAKIVHSLGNGQTSLTIDNNAETVAIIAANGLLVNGVPVTVP
jgi:Phage protein Gp138 N-terminal domain